MIKDEFVIQTIEDGDTNPLVANICECVFLYNSMYKEIFCKLLKNYANSAKAPRIVKIKTGKYTFWRRFVSGNAVGITKTAIGFDRFTAQQIRSLNNNNNKPVFQLSRGSHICFYWFHPFHSIRVAFKLGSLSVLLTIISLIISIIFQAKQP